MGIGLKSKAHWNGCTAHIVGAFSVSKQRWPVEVTLNDGQTKKALIRSSNLKRIEPNSNADEKETQMENKQSEKEKGTDDVSEDVALEASMGGFQSLIDEMHRVRKAAVSGQLTDDERRRMAAETAMKLAPFMGLGDDTDDCEDSDEDSDGVVSHIGDAQTHKVKVSTQ